MSFPYEEFDLSGIGTYPLKSRPSKVRVDQFARPCGAEARVASFVDSLPDILAAADFKAVVRAILEARHNGGVIWGLGHAMNCELTEAQAKQRLGADYGSTSADGQFTLEAAYCLGNCAAAPSVMVNDTLYGRVTPERLDTILADWSKR